MKKNALKILFFLISYVVTSQDTIYFDKELNKTTSDKLAYFYKVSSQSNNNILVERRYFKNGQIRNESFYLIDQDDKKIANGINKIWYDTGELHLEINYKLGNKNGMFLSYWKNGQLKRKDIYKNGKLKGGECWDEMGNNVKYYDFEIRARFPGGETKFTQYIIRNFKYPEFSKRYKIGGKMVIDFKVDKTGKLSNIKIVENINLEIDEELLRVLKYSPKWSPAFQDGEAKVISFRIPIRISPNM